MKLGISSYSFPWAVGVPGHPQPSQRMTALDLLKEAQRMGANILQFGDNLPVTEMADGELDALAGAASSLEIALEIGTRGVETDCLQRHLDLAVRLRARLVRTLLPPRTDSVGVESIVNKLAAVLPRYEAAGVVLALENYELYSAAEFRAILRALPAPGLAMCLDAVNNLGRGESLDDLVAALGPRIACFHMKDVRIARISTRMGFLVEGCPAGEGVIDLRRVLSTLTAAEVPMAPLSVILEQWPPEQEGIEATIALERDWANRSFRHMRSVVKQA